MSHIRPPELEERLAGEEPPFVLDVRPEADFEAGHVEGSHNLPVYSVLADGDASALRDGLGAVPRDRPVVTVCHVGAVSQLATEVLEAEGYDAATLVGGMRDWRGYRHGALGYRLRAWVRERLRDDDR